jgi:hypothetical protein
LKKAERQAAVERSPEEFLPLTPAMFHILLALADKERHGYHTLDAGAGTV